MTRLYRILIVVVFCLVGPLAWASTVNINTATATEIAQNLKGVGPAKASAIVLYRKQHGPFHTVADLAKVRGIGKATVERNRSVLTVDSSPAKESQSQAQ